MAVQIIQDEPPLIAVAYVFYGEMYDQRSGITYNHWDIPEHTNQTGNEAHNDRDRDERTTGR
ncbi:hypothetical protein LCGC14_3002800 [marine sediment metagenome]|uniref:Uncharacterized protein n=1 Tax=marine sediment metagenome TaxID=412755 RepID=A0A0F8ZRM0_9ZZZZ